MGINNFEKLIQSNQEYFEKEPSIDHMEKFAFMLREQEEVKKKSFLLVKQSSWWLAAAASVIILISFSWYMAINPIQQIPQQQIGLSFELTKIKNYYTQDNTKKLKEIGRCSKRSSQTEKILRTTESQLMKLNFNAEKIENKLVEAPGNKQLELAYVLSLKTQNDIVNKVHQEICSNNKLLTQ